MSFQLDRTVGVLQQVLGRAALRTEILASNIANIDTPGYRAMDVRFPDVLDAARDFELRQTRHGHLAPAGGVPHGARVEPAPVTRVRLDGNTVDIDREMTLLAMTQGRYRTSAEMLRKRFALLTYAATDGRAGA